MRQAGGAGLKDVDYDPERDKSPEAPKIDLTNKRNAVKVKKGQPHPDQPMDEITGKPKEINSAGDNKRPDMSGGSVGNERDENSTLEAIHAIYNLGLSDDELNERVGRHYQFKDAGGGAQGDEYSDKERETKIKGAIEGARKILAHFTRGDNSIELGLGSLGKGITPGGQNTDIPDDFRSDFLDVIQRDMFGAISDREGGSAMQIITDELFGGGGSGNTKDNLWPADIFLTNKDEEGRIRGDFDKLKEVFMEDGDNMISPGIFVQMVGEMLAREHRDGNTVGYSLKELFPDKYDTKVYDTNTEFDTPAQILTSVVRGDINIPTGFKTNKAGVLRGKKGFNFDQLTDMLLNPEDEDSQYKAIPKFAGMTRGKPGYYKVEPVGQGAEPRFGMAPTNLMRKLVQDVTGDELSYNTNDASPDGSGGSKPEDVLNSPNFDDSQIEYWQDMLEDLTKNPSKTFNIGNEFQWGDENVSPRDFIKNMLTSFNMTDDELNSDDKFVQRGEHQYDKVEGRMETISMLKNFRMYQMFRNADNKGELSDVLGRLISSGGKISTSEEDPFFPFAKVAGKQT